MAIKLLSKQEIAQSKASERSKEVSEGLKLSRRVDGLRELAAKEEEKLEKWRVATLSEIQNEIDGLVEEKSGLVSEVNELRKEKSKGLKEVEQEMLSVTSLRNSLDGRQQELNARESEIERQELQLTLNLRNVNDELLRAKTHTEETANLQWQAQCEKKDADYILSDAKKVEQKTLRVKESAEKEIESRLSAISSMEESVMKREQTVFAQEEQIKVEKIKLADGWETLKRAIKRNG